MKRVCNAGAYRAETVDPAVRSGLGSDWQKENIVALVAPKKKASVRENMIVVVQPR